MTDSDIDALLGDLAPRVCACGALLESPVLDLCEECDRLEQEPSERWCAQ